MTRITQVVFLTLVWFQIPLILRSQEWTDLLVSSASGANEGVGVAYTESGSLFFAGNHRGNIEIAPFYIQGSNFQKGFWGKRTSNGTIEWLSSIEGSKDVFLVGIEIHNEKVAIAGYYVDSLFIEQDTLVNTLQKGIFIALFDTSGNYYYTIHPDVNSATIYDLIFDNDGHLLVTGNYYLNFNFGGYSVNSPLGMSMFLFKFDIENGELKWLTTSEGTGTNGSGVSIDADNNVCVAGSYGDGTSIQGLALDNNNGNHNFYIAKFTPLGSVEWVRTIIGLGQVHGADVRMNLVGESYVTGDFQMNIDSLEGAILVSEGHTNAFVGKFDADGNLVWLQRIGGTNNDKGISILLDSTGAPLILFDSSVDANILGTSLEPFGFLEPLILKLHPEDGSYVWHTRITALENSGTVNSLSFAVNGNRIAVTGKNRTGLMFQNQLFIAPNFSEFFIASFVDTLYVEIHEILTNGTQGDNENINLTVFPNPSEDYFRCVSKDVNIDEILIYTLRGELVFSHFPNEKEFDFGANLEKGFYLAKFRVNRSEFVSKLIKK